jgi:hypothetical protein
MHMQQDVGDVVFVKPEAFSENNLTGVLQRKMANQMVRLLAAADCRVWNSRQVRCDAAALSSTLQRASTSAIYRNKLVCVLQEPDDVVSAVGSDFSPLTSQQQLQLAGNLPSVGLAQLGPDNPDQFKEVMFLGATDSGRQRMTGTTGAAAAAAAAL